MNYLYAMNIYIFLFLVHIVANKERFFIKRTDNGKKVEFTLNVNTAGGGNFYNILKANKIINQNMTKGEEPLFLCPININAPPFKPSDIQIKYPIGQIIGNQNGLMIFLEELNENSINEKIGNIDVNNQPDFI